MARSMVMEYGMSEKLGWLRYRDNQDEVFLGHSVARSQSVSEDTARLIDQEVRRLVEEGETTARTVLTESSTSCTSSPKRCSNMRRCRATRPSAPSRGSRSSVTATVTTGRRRSPAGRRCPARGGRAASAGRRSRAREGAVDRGRTACASRDRVGDERRGISGQGERAQGQGDRRDVLVRPQGRNERVQGRWFVLSCRRRKGARRGANGSGLSPPKGSVRMSSSEIVAEMNAIPAAQRASTTVRTAFYRMMAKRFPCR